MNLPGRSAHPFNTRKGGDLLSAYLFPHMCLAWIVQKFSFGALSAAPVFSGENPHFPIESFIPEMYSQSSFYVLSKGSQTALCGKRTTFDENCRLITKKNPPATL